MRIIVWDYLYLDEICVTLPQRGMNITDFPADLRSITFIRTY